MPGSTHIALLGDSIFDNAAYVPAGRDVTTHVRSLLPRDGDATLLAVDGAVISDVHAQIARIPARATHIVLSAGGNDALGHTHLLDGDARVLVEFGEAIAAFFERYRKLLRSLAGSGRPLITCTIYNGNLGPEVAPAATAALGMFNDAICRAARAASARVIELRDVCTRPGDYANPIEPSDAGGRKIAAAIVDTVFARS